MNTTRRFTALLLLMTLLGIFPLDVILPSVPSLSTQFSVTPEDIALSISLFVFAVAGTQLLIGPLSDRLGRKPLLLVGILLSIVGAVGCLYSPNYATFLIFRILQALGCGCFVLTQALVQDIFAGQQRNAVRVLLTTASGVFISLSPLAGSWLQEHFDWPGSFAAFALLGGTLFILCGVLLNEAPRPSGTSLPFLAAYGKLLKDRRFLSYSTLVALAFACHLSFIVVSPLLFMGNLGFSTYEFSLVFLLYGIAYVVGGTVASVANRRLAPRVQIGTGIGLIALAGAALLVWNWSGEISAPSILLPMILCTAGISLCRPAATGCALELHPDRAGTAASLLNTIVFACGAMASGAVALMEDSLLIGLGAGFLLLAVIGSALIYTTMYPDQRATPDLP